MTAPSSIDPAAFCTTSSRPRRCACGTRPGPAQLKALAEYESVRDALALPMLDVTERLASYDWQVTEVSRLVMRPTSVMTDDLRALAPICEAA